MIDAIVNLKSLCTVLCILSRCRAFFCVRSSGASSEHRAHGAENSLFRVVRHPSYFKFLDDVHNSEPSPPVFPIAFPKHGAHDAAPEFFQDHPQTALLASSLNLRQLLSRVYVRGLFRQPGQRERERARKSTSVDSSISPSRLAKELSKKFLFFCTHLSKKKRRADTNEPRTKTYLIYRIYLPYKPTSLLPSVQ